MLSIKHFHRFYIRHIIKSDFNLFANRSWSASAASWFDDYWGRTASAASRFSSARTAGRTTWGEQSGEKSIERIARIAEQTGFAWIAGVASSAAAARRKKVCSLRKVPR